MPAIQATVPRNQHQGVFYFWHLQETKTKCLVSGLRYRNQIKASITITWFSMPEIQTKVPRHQDQHVCYYRQMPETRTMRLESGPRCLKSRHMRTEIRAKMLEIKTNV